MTAMPPARRSFVELVDDVRTEVARLNATNAELRAERDRARETAAHLEQLLAEARRLLEWTVRPTTSHALEEQIGRDIAQYLRETGEPTSALPGEGDPHA